MAYIPYGYRIVEGRAVIEETEAARIRKYVKFYLKGDPIRKAMEEAGLSIDVNKATRMLTRRVYLGDGYYPAILDEETFAKIAEEKAQRYEKMGSYRNPGSKGAPPVRKLFRMGMDLNRSGGMGTDMGTAAMIYEGIYPDEDGSRQISGEDRKKVQAWIAERRRAWQSE